MPERQHIPAHRQRRRDDHRDDAQRRHSHGRPRRAQRIRGLGEIIDAQPTGSGNAPAHEEHVDRHGDEQPSHRGERAQQDALRGEAQHDLHTAGAAALQDGDLRGMAFDQQGRDDKYEEQGEAKDLRHHDVERQLEQRELALHILDDGVQPGGQTHPRSKQPRANIAAGDLIRHAGPIARERANRLRDVVRIEQRGPRQKDMMHDHARRWLEHAE